MRKLQNRYLLLGCAIGIQLLCATKGYSHKIDYVNGSPEGKRSPNNGHQSARNVQKENLSAAKGETDKQEKISGKVTGPDGRGIQGVTVQIKGTKTGVVTNQDGLYTVNATKGDVLVFSFIGFETREITVTDDAMAPVALAATSKQLTEVVVTALGITHRTKDLTYAVQKLTNSDLTTVKDLNFINSLDGKIAGLTVTQSSSGFGGSSRVILRGNKSTRTNDPLYVIDGVPLQNYSPAQPADVWGQATSTGGGGTDGGDGISNLNPDDIESITVLKGASGAALYGSAAANGVIVVTLKSGHANKFHINVSSSATAETPLYYPEEQYKYGQGSSDTATVIDPMDNNSWGPVVNGPNFVKPFFQTGVTTINSISLSGGTDQSQTYFSWGNAESKGILPFSTLSKNNLTFRQVSKYLNDKLVLDANVLFVDQVADNRPVSGLYANPLTGLYLFPRGVNFNQYKQYTQFNVARNVDLQNWYDMAPDGTGGTDHEQNPYWVINKMPTNQHRDRAITNIVLRYQLTDWLSAQGRGNFDQTWDINTQKMYAGTQSVQSGMNGRYSYFNTTNRQIYGDFILAANKKLSTDLSLQANLGTSITDNLLTQIGMDEDPATGPGLFYANQFGLNEIDPSSLLIANSQTRKQQQAVFASAELGYKNFLYLDLTGRNDWSSTFANTPTVNKGYFYWSAGANMILSEAMRLPEAISFAKVRASYAKVGNDVAAYSTNPPQWTKQGNINTAALLTTVVPLPGTYLQPEDNRSFEVGTEWRFMHDRFGIDLTYYKNNNYKQYVLITAPNGSGFTQYYLNLGNIQNQGVEIMAYATPVQTRKVKWTTTVNYAYNENKVVSLSQPGVAGANAGNAYILTKLDVNMFQSQIVQGGSWGDIYGHKLARAADGSILVDATGAPTTLKTVSGTDSIAYIGNPNPHFTLGWNNEVSIGNFEIDFLIDGHFGGKVMSVTQAVLDQYGDSKASGQARDAGGLNIKATNSVTNKPFDGLVPAQAFYTAVGGRAGIGEYYMYDATAIRLRELSIGYNIPIQMKGISKLNVSLIGRNLFFLEKKAPFDPETSMATNNGLQGIDTFAPPATRSMGASVKIQF
jgi:TonB-linked SusC/RagA family outer membrane protein